MKTEPRYWDVTLKAVDDFGNETRQFDLAFAPGLAMAFIPGQFVAVLCPKEGKIIRRAYSIASAPEEGRHLELIIKRVEGDVGKLLRRPELGFLNLVALPQEVEGLVRAHSLRRVMESLSRDLPEGAETELSSVGVMFFSGGLLSVSDDQLQEVAKDVFGRHLTPGQIKQLHGQMSDLLKKERNAVAESSKSELARLIRGEGGPYVTLWDRAGEN